MFTLEQIAFLTNLSDRTLRNYIKDGFLQGDKSTGKWLFSNEQFYRFMNHPAVVPALEAKKTAIITDYLSTKPEESNRICVILDVKEYLYETMKLFLELLSEIGENVDEELYYSSDKLGDKMVRFIIRGSEIMVMDILTRYREEKQSWLENCPENG